MSRWDLYSETTYGTSEVPGAENFINTTKLSYSFFRFNDVRFYGGVVLDQDTRSDQSLVFNDNHVAPLAGLQIAPEGIPFGFFLEGRAALRPSGSRPEARESAELYSKTGLFGYDQRDLARVEAFGRRNAFFNEAYGEAVYVSKIDPGATATIKDKLGLRVPLVGNAAGTAGKVSLAADFYGEGILKRSSLDYLAENLQEAGPAARLSARFGALSAAASVRKGYGTYVSPSGSSNYTGWTGLFVIAGEM